MSESAMMRRSFWAGLFLALPLLLPASTAFAADPEQARFFQVKEDGGAWSLVDPQKQKFFSVGINCVNPEDHGKGKRYNGLKAHGGDQKKWAAATLKRLDDWNVNTIGAWSALRGKPYVIELSLGYSYADVFSDDFEKHVKDRAREVLKDIGAEDYATLDKDPLLIGYFTDNELSWGWGYGWKDKEGLDSLFERFAALKPEDPGKRAWAAYLAETYKSDWKRLSQVWDVNVNNADDLLNVKKIAPLSPEVHKEAKQVADGFVKRYAERYFSITNGVMRRHLPNHLNLGCRMTPGNPTPVIEVAGRYCDVLSYNMYEKDVDRIKDELARLHRLGKRPVMLTEYAFLAKENRTGNTNKGYERVVVRSDKERGEHYAKCMAALSRLPFVVGLHWFQYHDEPSEGRADGENCNFGFVDVEDEVYEDLAKAASEANGRALTARQKSLGPTGQERPRGASTRRATSCRPKARRLTCRTAWWSAAASGRTLGLLPVSAWPASRPRRTARAWPR
jgi:hypothetical protein